MHIAEASAVVGQGLPEATGSCRAGEVPLQQREVSPVDRFKIVRTGRGNYMPERFDLDDDGCPPPLSPATEALRRRAATARGLDDVPEQWRSIARQLDRRTGRCGQ